MQLLAMTAPVFSVLPINASCFAKTPYLVHLPLLGNGQLARQKAAGSLRSDGGNRWCGKEKGAKLVVRAGDMLGDFGAREPFPAEIESNFGEKVLGDPGTDHKILIPNAPSLSLADRSCEPLPAGQHSLSQQEATALLRKVVGWRIVDGDDGSRLECLWKVKNFAAGIELFNRIASVAETAGHHLDLHVEEGNRVRAQIWTNSIGGLSLNDFILAAKIDQIKTSDLVPRKRVWA